MANCISPIRASELSKQRDRAFGLAATVLDMKLAAELARTMVERVQRQAPVGNQSYESHENKVVVVNHHADSAQSWVEHLLDRAPLDLE